MILVVGATGRLGGEVTRRLLRRGDQVRILVRRNSPSEVLAREGMATPASSLVEAGAEQVFGDLKDRSSLDAACRGAETVITTANSAARGGEDNPQTVDWEGNRNLIDAAKAAGVRHFIYVSAQIADPESPSPFLAAKGRTEEYLRSSGLDYTIVAPDAFMDVWIALVVGTPAINGRPVTVVGSGKRRHSFIAMADVAGFVVAAVNNPDAVNRKLVIGGPEAVSFREAAELYGRLLDREIPVRSVEPGEPVPGLPESVWGVAAGFDRFDSVFDTTEAARRFGVSLTSMEEFARRHVAMTEQRPA